MSATNQLVLDVPDDVQTQLVEWAQRYDLSLPDLILWIVRRAIAERAIGAPPPPATPVPTTPVSTTDIPTPGPHRTRDG